MKGSKAGKLKDRFLENRMARYDRLLAEGSIRYSSQVIPINESLTAKQWILPRSQAAEILRNSRSLALTQCECRDHYRRCSNPLDVCLIMNEAADKQVREGRARYVSLDEAKSVLSRADASGLIHLAFFAPGRSVYALCSCCSCCCHDLQLLKSYGRRDLISHADYSSRTDTDMCVDCGTCIERCVFEARTWDNGRMRYHPEKCYGCGLCVTACLAKAVALEHAPQDEEKRRC